MSRPESPRRAIYRSSLEASEAAQVQLPTGEASTSGRQPSSPLMADLMCGARAPLTRAFIMAGWRTVPVEILD